MTRHRARVRLGRAAQRVAEGIALLPATRYNASVAWAIEVRGGTVRVCGCADRYEVSRHAA